VRILLTGATGYIGGRLVPILLERGHDLRCLARRPERLEARPWRDRVEVAAGDVLDPDSLDAALEGCDAAVYLVHSMARGKDFEEQDRAAATTFGDAAGRARLRRLVYLGGLGPEGEEHLSPHLKSRHEVGRLLAGGPVPTTEIRAAVIIGSGSLSFEMLRYLTEVLPIMTTPRWVRTRCQPISVRDVLTLLAEAVEDTSTEDRILEAGGPDVLTYTEMMQIYAEEAGLRRRIIIPVPVLSPGLSSLWVGLVTPLPPSIARPLVESLRHEAVVRSAPAVLPAEPTPYREAVRRALDREPGELDTRKSDTGWTPSHPVPGDPDWSGGTEYLDRRVVPTDAEPRHLYWACTRIGGSVGYYGMNWAWRLRGLLDQLVGGVGLRRGRRDPEDLRIGEAVDFWRVETVVPDRMLRLHAEMRLPGEAWLEWEIVPTTEGSDLVQTARFRPRGLFGRLYWFLMAPFHSLIFPRMAARMAAAAEERGYSCC
jgi:uncharacterized protein YbjT (DUF2867 family)